MPELPEVETIRRALAKPLVGAEIVGARTSAKRLRFGPPRGLARRLTSRKILAVRRRAKYLLWDLAPRGDYAGDSFFLHLGMSGRVLLWDGSPPPIGEHEHARFSLRPKNRRGRKQLTLGFLDPRRFGSIGITPTARLAQHPRFQHLGVEPLREVGEGGGLTAAWLLEEARATRTNLKAFLLDQTRIAGLGNIYVCEALHRARLSPLRMASALRPAEARRLCAAIQAVLARALQAGGSSLGRGRSNFVAASGEMGYFQLRFAAYGRAGQACPRRGCGGKIASLAQSGRSSFYCSRCQT